MKGGESTKMECSSIKYCSSTSAVHAVAMPYPGRGHINPMMNLCKLISLKKPDILISFVVTEEWYSLISSSIIPPNITLRTIPNVIPSEHVRAKDFPGFFDAVGKNMESPFELLLDKIKVASPVRVIIADTYLDWVVRVGNRRNIPVASLWTMSASVFSIFYHFDLLQQNGHFPIQLSERGEEQVEYIPGLCPIRLADFPTVLCNVGHHGVMRRGLDCVSIVSKAQYLLLTSTYELEPQVLDALRLELPFLVLTLGPTIPHFELGNTNLDDRDLPNYVKWLNSQPDDSVLYVSMGSFLSLSTTQMDEIIAGIFDSGVRCFWVTRDKTIMSRNDDTRLVVPWCDQLRVLSHPSIGGFWTHCGWNSTLEAAFSGIPILASPIFWDQVPNSKSVVEDWKTGWRLRRGVEDESLVTREEIREMVKDFMNGESSEVKELRRRAKQLKEVCQAATTKGGSSDSNLDFFIHHALRSSSGVA